MLHNLKRGVYTVKIKITDVRRVIFVKFKNVGLFIKISVLNTSCHWPILVHITKAMKKLARGFVLQRNVSIFRTSCTSKR